KVSLWMEAMEPGKPLAFLDHRIKCGNSLLGATPALLKKGIPDEAFKPIERDDKEVCREFRKRNREERKGIRTLFDAAGRPWERLGDLPMAMASIDGINDATIDGVREKQERYEQLVKSTGYEFSRLWADTWCAAFVWRKVREADGGLPYPITEEVFRRIEKAPHSVPPWLKEEVHRLAEEYNFFHWHLAFPNVFRVPTVGYAPDNKRTGWCGGFDVVLGNPPWDTMSPDAKEFFAAYNPQVRFLKKAEQQALFAQLLQDSHVADSWSEYRRRLFASVHFMKSSGRYRLFAPGNLGKGDFDLYRMFVETALEITAKNGFAAQIVKSGIYNGANAQAIRKELYERWELLLVLGFINTRQYWFPSVHPETRFALYVARRRGTTKHILANFMLDGPESFAAALSAPIMISLDVIHSQSPDALAIPEVASSYDISVAQKMYKRWPAFGDKDAGPPHRHYQREIDMGNDRDLFGEFDAGLPLYEGRMIDQYDHRAKAYRSGRGRAAVWEPLPFSCSGKGIVPQWWVPPENIPPKLGDRPFRYRIGFCDISTATAPRSLLAAIIPPRTICGHSVPTICFEVGYEWAYMIWLAIANSFCMDFLIRKRVTLHMSYTILDAMPFPRLSLDDPIAHLLGRLALRLTCVSSEMTEYWNAMATYGWCETIPEGNAPPGYLDEIDRATAKAQIDAIVARYVYGLTGEELSYVLDTFSSVRTYEEKTFGEYRTKRVILEAYDKVSEVGDITVSEVTEQVVQAVLGAEEVPLEDFAAMAYPTTETDKAICAAALAAVEQSPGLSSMDHLDALLLATHPDWCKTFLDQEDQQAFSAVVNSAPSTLFVDETQSIRWKECRDYLEQLQAISLRHGDKSQAIGLGADSISVKSNLPGGVDEIVGYAIKAMKRIAELRKDLST
ncbi:MAG: hypothetical protein DRP97_08190, partial [Candidatus Latescibacterota bacterium]